MNLKKNSNKLNESSGVTSSIKPKDSIHRETRTEPAKLSHSVSLPLLPYKKEMATPTDKKGKMGKKDKEFKKTAGEFDSIFGAVIIMVALMVTLAGGKMCAILCTAAWMYFIPRVRANFVDDYALKLRIDENYVDLDSKEHKKKVVLQGLLDRSQHF
ncbi:hypothetical protein CDL12_07372 [Handroanthus impetiginosus]|uniref:Uncharacterized protein n=1 Tax=Handroanthus impetiginosus TaxID=429701 RepID=A0A2G9HQZ9_9LAMI|nr:hypothetical protein CDL12_07372 [Handroanthus impetiginosus]